MDFEGALRARLTADATVAALVGNRVYWVDRPQSDGLPAITLQIIFEERAQNMRNFDGLQRVVVQADGWAGSYGTGKALKEAIIAALVPEHVGNGIRFLRAEVTARDMSERTETQFYHRPSMDFTFHYAVQ